MKCSALIDRAIEDSGMSLREVARRCTDAGVPITHSYLSKVRSGACNPPSDTVVKALAQVLCIDYLELALQAHVDRAPKGLRGHSEEFLRRLANAS